MTIPSVVGIDLGTTFSLAAFVENGRPVVIRDDRGAALGIPAQRAKLARCCRTGGSWRFAIRWFYWLILVRHAQTPLIRSIF